MDIQHIKQISITDYLQQQGYAPTLIKGINHWYCPPFRQERTPSFKVNTERNQWYDFGTGEHGDIIDLVRALQHCNIAEAMYLLEHGGQLPQRTFSFGGNHSCSTSAFEILSIEAITHPNLRQYLAERSIALSTAERYCSELHYCQGERHYYGFGFPNDVGGWELRNPYFKGSIAPKAISTLTQESESLQLFEGFMDFLSWQTLNPSSTCDVIILNSLALLPRIQEKIKSYKQVETFLDNDNVGRKSFEVLKQFCSHIIDGSVRYRPHKDLNEWLIYQTKMKKEQALHSNAKHRIRR